MEVNLNKAKQEFMNIVKRKLKIMAIKVVAVISIIVMLACFCYVIWDATIGKAIDVFGNTITSLAKIFTNESGSKLEIDSGDLEDNLVKELEAMNLDVDTLNIGTKEGDKDEKLKYLKKYLAAEVVTLYPNVSVDQGLFKRDLQGIVTIEKLTANGSAQKLKYKSYDDFKEDLESGDSDVNNYFTINSNNDVIVAKRTVENDVTTYSEQKIEYQNTISGYTMPFEFLLSLAQITQNPEYVAAVADLIIKESEIKVTVFETKTTTTTVETLYYTNNKKKIPVSEATAGSVTEPTIEQETDKSEEIQRTVKEEYTLSTDVTYARVWCGTKKIDEISITENEPTTIPSELSEAPEYIEEEPATEGEWKTDAKKQTIQTIQSQTKKVGQATSEIDTELFMGLWKNSTGKYEKTDFNSDGTMTNQAAKYDKNGKKVKYEVEEKGTKEAPIDNILSAPEMLFEFLEKSERTQKQEDFLKYCLYLYTGTDYGVTSLEFSIFDAGSFLSINIFENIPDQSGRFGAYYNHGFAMQQDAPSSDKILNKVIVSTTSYDTCYACCEKVESDPSYGLTATGIKLQPGMKVIAVDPNVIPLGSWVYVPGYGYALAADTGGFINGHHIDVYVGEVGDNIGTGNEPTVSHGGNCLNAPDSWYRFPNNASLEIYVLKEECCPPSVKIDYNNFSEDMQTLMNLSDEQVWSLLTNGVINAKPTDKLPSNAQAITSAVTSQLVTIQVPVRTWANPNNSNDLTITSSTISITVNKALQNIFSNFFNDLYNNVPNFVITEYGGYRLDGTGVGQIGYKSAHTYGAAIDLNWSTDGNGYTGWNVRGPFTYEEWKALPETHTKYETIYYNSPMVQIAHKYTMTWGGEWSSVKDSMHFSFIGDYTRAELKSRYGN